MHDSSTDLSGSHQLSSPASSPLPGHKALTLTRCAAMDELPTCIQRFLYEAQLETLMERLEERAAHSTAKPPRSSSDPFLPSSPLSIGRHHSAPAITAAPHPSTRPLPPSISPTPDASHLPHPASTKRKAALEWDAVPAPPAVFLRALTGPERRPLEASTDDDSAEDEAEDDEPMSDRVDSQWRRQWLNAKRLRLLEIAPMPRCCSSPALLSRVAKPRR